MCSIMVYCAPEAPLEKFKEGFMRTKYRGPDDSRITDTGKGLFGFHRLAIMGLGPEGMQPFSLNGNYLVCNGEIYGFEKIRKNLEGKYTFRSRSDCEVLLPMYAEYGTDMFAMLDAEFVCVIYDAAADAYVAARDPIGIRPMFYGYDDKGVIVFASEAANLVGITDKIMPFPPGCYYKGGRFYRYADVAKTEKVCTDSFPEVLANIREKLIAGIEKRLVSDAKTGFLLSGGLDSSLVCSVAAKASERPITTFSIGMSEDAIDLKYAREVADYIKSDHREVIISKEDVLDALETVVRITGTFDITTIRASIGMYLVCRAVHRTTNIKVLLTGEISDELFGYKYTDFAPSAEAFQAEAEKRVRELYMYDVLRADRCISANSLEARVPFGDLDFVKYVMSLPPEIKMNIYGKGKYLLRKAFEGDYLPAEILFREKAAFSDAVGHSMVDCLKQYAEGLYSDVEFEEKRAKYSHARPFTKESLLYRELFEKYYPGQGHMICGFWMPNKQWKGCDVDDPSARVLANYGDSGK